MSKSSLSTFMVGECLFRQSWEKARLLRRGADELDKVRKTYRSCSRPKVAGRCAEVHHKVTYNVDAVRKGVRTRARLTTPGAAADLVVGRRLVQVKYRKTAVQSAGRAADRKYSGMDLILPADQASRAVSALKKGSKRAVIRNPLKAAARLDAAKRVKKTVEVGGAKSRPLTKRGAQALARKGGDGWRREAIMNELVATSAGHFASGALHAAAFCGAKEAHSVLRKGRKPAKAVKAVAKAAAIGGVAQLGSASLTAVIEVGAKKMGTKALIRGHGAAAIADGALDICKHGYSYVIGEIDGEQFAKDSLRSTARSGAALAAAKYGAIAGTLAVGPVGGVIGGVMAAIAASLVFDQVI